MEIQEIITKWKLNKQHLAFKMGMLRGTFNNKLNPMHPTQFTDAEMIKLKQLLVELRTDLEDVPDIDFNDALAIISRKLI